VNQMGWQVKRIGDVCKTGAGGTPRKSNKEYYEGGTIPWLLSGEVSQGEIFNSNKVITAEGLENSSAKLFPPDTVLVAMYGATAGQVGILRIEAATNQAVCGIYPNEKVLPEYLYYAMLSKKDSLIASATGNAQPNISQIKVKNTEIPLPPLREQKQIVAILDKAFATIDQAVANAERNLTNARELFESYLNKVFIGQDAGWNRLRVDEVCLSIIDCINKTAPKVDEPTPYKMIRTTNIRNGVVDLSKVKYVSTETYQAWTRRQVPEVGDVLLTREAPLGEVGMLLSDDQVFLGQRIVSYRADPGVMNNEFLLYMFQSSDIQTQISRRASGSTVQHMRVPDTKNLDVSVPPLLEQAVIVSKLNKIRKDTQSLEAIYQQKLTALTELKQSILQKAFRGELTAGESYE